MRATKLEMLSFTKEEMQNVPPLFFVITAYMLDSYPMTKLRVWKPIEGTQHKLYLVYSGEKSMQYKQPTGCEDRATRL